MEQKCRTNVDIWHMKSQLTFCFLLLAIVACKRTANVDEQPATTNPQTSAIPTADTSKISTTDSITANAQASGKAADEITPVPAKPKICDPNFTKLSSPKKNLHIIYVTNFIPEEFKCWVNLEEYGTKTCGGNPGVVVFVDNANIKTSNTPPNYIDDNTLKNTGIARYEYNGKYWELKGASIWKRSGKGYGYYNTDNQLGG